MLQVQTSQAHIALVIGELMSSQAICGLWEALLSVVERMKVKKVNELIFTKDLK